MKRRLVGFLVLIALAVIFWPIIFGSPVKEPESVLPVFEMAPKPEVARSRVTPPVTDIVDRSRLPSVSVEQSVIQQAADVANVSSDEVLASADDEPEAQSAARQRAEFTADGLPVSWTLQVATFSRADRAEAVVVELQKKGHKAYVAPVTMAERRLFRVRVGPNIQRQRLIDIQSSVDAYFGVESKIVRFEVDGLPASWTLQVATFSRADRAEAILVELREQGHKAYIAPVTMAGGQLFRVRVGPHVERQPLIDIQASIDAHFGVESELIRVELE